MLSIAATSSIPSRYKAAHLSNQLREKVPREPPAERPELAVQYHFRPARACRAREAIAVAEQLATKKETQPFLG
jgi:ATP/maltotriose-dependent transcriptional regulator MalT